MSGDGPIQIRSFRVCFDLERRIHKIDRWRLPVPYGVPLRGIAYAFGLLVALAFARSVPVLGAAVSALHPSLRYLIIPVGGAYLFTRWRVDGRAAHAAALSCVRMWLAPRRLCAFRRAPALQDAQVRIGAVTFAPDERCARLRRGIVSGPAEIVVRYPFRARRARRTLHIRQAHDQPMWRGKQVTLQRGQRLSAR